MNLDTVKKRPGKFDSRAVFVIKDIIKKKGVLSAEPVL